MRRKAYKRAVNRAKRKFDEKRYDKLETMMSNPKKWWKAVRKLGVVGRKVKAKDVSKVLNEFGEVKEGEEAVGVWKRHFEKVMNSEGVTEECRGLENGEATGRFRLMDEDLQREEVVSALGGLKRKVAAGRDGLTAEMVCCGSLVEFWWCLYNWCWKFGMIPTEWQKSVVVPIPKKQKSGPCRVDEFRGISLVSVPYKVLCSIVQRRMVEVVEEQGLVAEEQGGFRRGRGCRDQVLSLMLLGQIKARSGRGMFATFIDFRKAYDRVDRSKLWQCLRDSGFCGRALSFLQAAYRSLSCEVRIDSLLSESFTVSRGLRQGCILSPLLFSLYINSLVEKLRGAGVGVECGGQKVAALLYADDAVLMAEDENQVKRGLKVLEEWCREWGVEVNVEKSGVMHMRRRSVKRTGETFLVNGERIAVVQEYRYLGCVVNEQLNCTRMVEERAKAGAKALNDWIRRCRAAVGELRGETFVKLLEMLVDSVLLYGAEVWGSCGKLAPIEKIQLRAARIFFGVGRLHPKVSLQFELNILPLEWEAMKRCIEFWVRVMRMSENRLLKQVMMEVMEVGDGVRWKHDLEKSLRMFGWEGLGAEGLSSLSLNEVRQMLRDVAWRQVVESWRVEARSHSKLVEVGKIIEKGCKERCMEVKCKRKRRILTKLRGGTAGLEIETGRWRGISREDRLCKNCQSGEVEDVEHLLLRCTSMAEEREKLMRLMKDEVVEWQNMEDSERVTGVLSAACRNGGVGRSVERMWLKRFGV